MEKDPDRYRYRAWLDGDSTAFDSIVLEYRRGLIRFIQGYVHDEYDAEDISMDVFVYVLMNPRKYDYRVSVKTYLYMIGRSRALDHLRHSRTVSSRCHDGEVSENEPAPRGTSEDPESKLIRNERSVMLTEAVSSLPEGQQTALKLIYDEEMSYAEAAAVMRVSEKKIDNLVTRAKKCLRNRFQEDFLND